MVSARFRRALSNEHATEIVPSGNPLQLESSIIFNQVEDFNSTKSDGNDISSEYSEDDNDDDSVEEYPEVLSKAELNFTREATIAQKEPELTTTDASRPTEVTFPTLVLIDPEIPFQASISNPFLVEPSLFVTVPPATEEVHAVEGLPSSDTMKTASNGIFNEVNDFNDTKPDTNDTNHELDLKVAELRLFKLGDSTVQPDLSSNANISVEEEKLSLSEEKPSEEKRQEVSLETKPAVELTTVKAPASPSTGTTATTSTTVANGTNGTAKTVGPRATLSTVQPLHSVIGGTKLPPSHQISVRTNGNEPLSDLQRHLVDKLTTENKLVLKQLVGKKARLISQLIRKKLMENKLQFIRDGYFGPDPTRTGRKILSGVTQTRGRAFARPTSRVTEQQRSLKVSGKHLTFLF